MIINIIVIFSKQKKKYSLDICVRLSFSNIKKLKEKNYKNE